MAYTLKLLLLPISLLVCLAACQSDPFRTSAVMTTSQTGDASMPETHLEWPGHNLRLALNPEEWSSASRPARYDSNSDLSQELIRMRHLKTGFNFELLAVKPGMDQIATANEILTMQAAAKELEVLERRTEVINGIPYLVAQKRNPRMGSTEIVHIASYQGLVIHARAWTDKDEKSRIGDLELFAAEIQSNLSLIDNKRYFTSANARLLTDFDSPYGYRFRSGTVPYAIMDSPWTPPTTTELFLRIPETGASLSIIPFKLPDSNLRLEAIAHAYAFALNQNFVQHGQTQLHQIQNQPFPVVEYRMRQTDQAIPLYRIYRIVRSGDTAILKLMISDSDFLDHGFAGVADHFDFPTEDLEFPDYIPDPNRQALEARFMAGLGNYFIQRGNARRGLDYLSQAVDLDHYDEEILILYASGLSMNQRFEELRFTMEEARKRFPENLLVDRFLGLALYQTGQAELAAEAYRRLFEGGFIADGLIDEHFNGLLEANMVSVALEESAYWIERESNQRFSLWYGISLARSGATSEAISHFKSLPYESLYDTSYGGTLLNLKLEQQLFQEVVTLADKLYEDSGNSEYLLHQGIGLISLNQFAPAKEVIEQAIQTNPSHPHARGLLNHVETLLGHSDPSLYNDPIEAVPLGAHLQTLIEKHSEVEKVEYGAVMSYIGAAIEFERNETYRRSEYRRVHVQSETMLTGFKEFPITFNPLHESVYVNYLRVFDADGNLTAEGDPRSYYLSDRGVDNVVDQSRTLHVTIPGLTVGGSYKLLFTRRSNYTRRMPSVHFCFTGMIPRNLSFIQITASEDDFRHHTNSDDIQSFGEEQSHLWFVEHPPAIERHSHLPHYRTYMPTIWFGDTQFTEWSEPANEYLEEISSQLNDTCNTVEGIAANLNLAADATVAEKVAAVSEYIHRNFTYKALSFGMRARIPRDSATVVSNRYGDCKDLSILAVRLLRELGVEAHPSLVRTSMDFIPELPGLDQFDHMIVYVPEHEKAPLYDPADTNMGSLASARTVGLTPVLVLSETPFLYRPEAYDTKDGHIEIDRTVSILESGDVQVTENITLHGYSAALARDMFTGQPVRNHPVILQGILRHGGKSPMVQNLQIDNLERRNESMKMQYTYLLSNYWSKDEEEFLRGRIPSSWEQYLFFLERFPSERIGPVYIHHPVSIQSLTQLNIPAGWTNATLNVPSEESRSFPLGEFTRYSQMNADGSLQLRVEASLEQGTEPVENYPIFETFMDEVRLLSEPGWTIRM